MERISGTFSTDKKKEFSTTNSIFSETFRKEGEIKKFSDDEKLKKFVMRQMRLKEWLKKYFKQKGNNLSKKGVLKH